MGGSWRRHKNSKKRRKLRRDVFARFSKDGVTVACHWCGAVLEYAAYTIEHLVPFSVVRQNQPENMVPACHPCNSNRPNPVAR